jgi:hypothetical protein
MSERKMAAGILEEQNSSKSHMNKVYHWPHPKGYSIFTFPTGWDPQEGSL